MTEPAEVRVVDDEGEEIDYRVEDGGFGYHGCPKDRVVKISAEGGSYSMAPSNEEDEVAIVPLKALREFVKKNPELFLEVEMSESKFVPNAIPGLMAYYHSSDPKNPVAATALVVAWEFKLNGKNYLGCPVAYSCGDEDGGYAETEDLGEEGGGNSNFVGCYTEADEGANACARAIMRAKRG